MATVLSITFVMFVIVLGVFCVLLYRAQPKPARTEFLSDLYKLQQKWAKIGRADFAKGIGLLIDSEMMEDEEPDSDYGRQLKRQSRHE